MSGSDGRQCWHWVLCKAVDISLADQRRQTAVNLDGVFLSVKYAVPAMRRGGGGSIIITSPVAGLRGSAGLAGYCATKERAAVREGDRDGVHRIIAPMMSSRCPTLPLNTEPRLPPARINRKFATTISTIARFPQGGGHESMVAGGSSFGGSKAG